LVDLGIFIAPLCLEGWLKETNAMAVEAGSITCLQLHRFVVEGKKLYYENERRGEGKR
jgi:hypothetical protein